MGSFKEGNEGSGSARGTMKALWEPNAGLRLEEGHSDVRPGVRMVWSCSML